MTDTLNFKIQSIEVKLVMLGFYYELEIFGKISWKFFLILEIQSCLGLVEQFFIISTTKIVKKWNKIGMKQGKNRKPAPNHWFYRAPMRIFTESIP